MKSIQIMTKHNGPMTKNYVKYITKLNGFVFLTI